MSGSPVPGHPPGLRIGRITVSPGLLLAPMEDVSELPFRVICKRLGADLVYTEFVNAEGLLREAADGPQRTRRKLRFLPEERPVGIQLYGASEASMESAARIAAAQEPDLIDVNCGCWVKDVALRGAGAGLLRDLPRMKEVVSRVVRATDLPVTVKTRLGWDGESIRIVEVARMLEDLGVAALTIHCRTRTQGHQGSVDYSWVPRVKAAVAIPVILNGDVFSAQDAAAAFTETGCDGVMIGRGAIRHPWIFAEARRYLEDGSLLARPTLAERVALCLEHLRLAEEYGGEQYAVISLRRHYSGYFRDQPGSARLRAELAAVAGLDELRQRLRELPDANPDRSAESPA
ncbi:MAG: tRNA dihydrouridine synthase DusB [Candidatus Latescibacterota bacterium]